MVERLLDRQHPWCGQSLAAALCARLLLSVRLVCRRLLLLRLLRLLSDLARHSKRLGLSQPLRTSVRLHGSPTPAREGTGGEGANSHEREGEEAGSERVAHPTTVAQSRARGTPTHLLRRMPRKFARCQHSALEDGRVRRTSLGKTTTRDLPRPLGRTDVAWRRGPARGSDTADTRTLGVTERRDAFHIKKAAPSAARSSALSGVVTAAPRLVSRGVSRLSDAREGAVPNEQPCPCRAPVQPNVHISNSK